MRGTAFSSILLTTLATATAAGQAPAVKGSIRGLVYDSLMKSGPLAGATVELIELGRACVHPQHRNLIVLGLLWKGIAGYARERGARYLCGCSSLTSQDPAAGASAYSELCRKYLAPVPWRTRPLPAFECPLAELAAEAPKIPKLLRAYLALGARICGPPALDRQFKTIDFLTLLDLEALPALVKERLFS